MNVRVKVAVSIKPLEFITMVTLEKVEFVAKFDWILFRLAIHVPSHVFTG
jgi:hypothetical protein